MRGINRISSPLFLIVIAIGSVSCLVYSTVHPHVHWYFSDQRDICSDIVSIPARMSPSASHDEEWQKIQAGSVSLLVPLDMTVAQTPSDDTIIENDTRAIGIMSNSIGAFHTLQSEIGRSLPRGATSLSVPSVIAEIYKVAPTDFSWLMTHDELEWHKWLIGHARVARMPGVKSVELVRNQEVEGLLLIRDSSAWFEWYALRSDDNGYILFDDNDMRGLHWIRAVCQSISLPIHDSENCESEEVDEQ